MTGGSPASDSPDSPWLPSISDQVEEALLAQMDRVLAELRVEWCGAGQVNPVVDRAAEAPALDPIKSAFALRECEAEHLREGRSLDQPVPVLSKASRPDGGEGSCHRLDDA